MSDWFRDGGLLWLAVAVILVIIRGCMWDISTCEERSKVPTHGQMWVDTGNGTGYFMPTTYYECIRRK